MSQPERVAVGSIFVSTSPTAAGRDKFEPNRPLWGLCCLWELFRLPKPLRSRTPTTSPCPFLLSPAPPSTYLCASAQTIAATWSALFSSPTYPAGPLSEIFCVSGLQSGCSWHRGWDAMSGQGNGPVYPPALGFSPAVSLCPCLRMWVFMFLSGLYRGPSNRK